MRAVFVARAWEDVRPSSRDAHQGAHVLTHDEERKEPSIRTLVNTGKTLLGAGRSSGARVLVEHKHRAPGETLLGGMQWTIHMLGGIEIHQKTQKMCGKTWERF